LLNVASMRSLPVHSLGLFAALVGAGWATGVSALPLALFRYEAQAEVHCPHDVVVWLDFRRRAYYTSRQKRYALGATGSFVCRNEARSSGYRRSLLGIR
jgi:hypothetical protein